MVEGEKVAVMEEVMRVVLRAAAETAAGWAAMAMEARTEAVEMDVEEAEEVWAVGLEVVETEVVMVVAAMAAGSEVAATDMATEEVRLAVCVAADWAVEGMGVATPEEVETAQAAPEMVEEGRTAVARTVVVGIQVGE